MTERLHQLALEVDELLRTMPTTAQLEGICDANQDWIGRFIDFIQAWNSQEVFTAKHNLGHLRSMYHAGAVDSIRQQLYQAKSSLRRAIGTPASTVVGKGSTFDYYDSVRKLVERARKDLFFVDPYLSAEFVSAYLPHSTPGAAIRLLCSTKRLATLVPSVQQFCRQHGNRVELRTTDELHDRYVFMDGVEGYQSGASFKDGGLNAPTALTQLMDTLPVVMQLYETMWAAASKVVI